MGLSDPLEPLQSTREVHEHADVRLPLLTEELRDLHLVSELEPSAALSFAKESLTILLGLEYFSQRLEYRLKQRRELTYQEIGGDTDPPRTVRALTLRHEHPKESSCTLASFHCTRVVTDRADLVERQLRSDVARAESHEGKPFEAQRDIHLQDFFLDTADITAEHRFVLRKTGGQRRCSFEITEHRGDLYTVEFGSLTVHLVTPGRAPHSRNLTAKDCEVIIAHYNELEQWGLSVLQR